MIRTVIRNLVSNAIKFTESGKKVTVKSNEYEDKIKIAVEDEGVGMNDETINNLFQIDKQLSQKGTLGEEGTGLGLILCNDFIKRNSGELKVASEKNKGTTISFSLPVVE